MINSEFKKAVVETSEIAKQHILSALFELGALSASEANYYNDILTVDWEQEDPNNSTLTCKILEIAKEERPPESTLAKREQAFREELAVIKERLEELESLQKLDDSLILD